MDFRKDSQVLKSLFFARIRNRHFADVNINHDRLRLSDDQN